MNAKKIFMTSSIFTAMLGISTLNHSAISIDRTRVIFDGNQKSISINVSNNNKQVPYLAQGWIENAKGEKIKSPFVVLPPIQRVEPGKSSQIKVEALSAVAELPQNKESLFYFNMREIPPKSDKPNTLQIALQTKVKMFYRPKAILLSEKNSRFQENLILVKNNEYYLARNPTPYYITIIDAYMDGYQSLSNFNPIMIAPYSEESIKINQAGNKPVLQYINDYGARPLLNYL